MNSFIEGVFQLDTPFNMVAVIVIVMIGGTAVMTLMGEIRKYGCHQQELDFKRELLDRGLSADEIEQIVAAKGPVK